MELFCVCLTWRDAEGVIHQQPMVFESEADARILEQRLKEKVESPTSQDTLIALTLTPVIVMPDTRSAE